MRQIIFEFFILSVWKGHKITTHPSDMTAAYGSLGEEIKYYWLILSTQLLHIFK